MLHQVEYEEEEDHLYVGEIKSLGIPNWRQIAGGRSDWRNRLYEAKIGKRYILFIF